MSTIAIPTRKGEPDTRVRWLRKAIVFGLLGIVLVVGAVFVLAAALAVVLHLWLAPLELGWDALKKKRNKKHALE